MSNIHQLITTLINGHEFVEASQALNHTDVKLDQVEYQDLANQANRMLKKHANNVSTFWIKKILKSAGEKAKLLTPGLSVSEPVPVATVEAVEPIVEQPKVTYSADPKINNLILKYIYQSFQNADLVVCAIVLTVLLYVLKVNFVYMYQV